MREAERGEPARGGKYTILSPLKKELMRLGLLLSLDSIYKPLADQSPAALGY